MILGKVDAKANGTTKNNRNARAIKNSTECQPWKYSKLGSGCHAIRC